MLDGIAEFVRQTAMSDENEPDHAIRAGFRLRFRFACIRQPPRAQRLPDALQQMLQVVLVTGNRQRECFF